jgi:hypothetical protein
MKRRRLLIAERAEFEAHLGGYLWLADRIVADRMNAIGFIMFPAQQQLGFMANRRAKCAL